VNVYSKDIHHCYFHLSEALFSICDDPLLQSVSTLFFIFGL